MLGMTFEIGEEKTMLSRIRYWHCLQIMQQFIHDYLQGDLVMQFVRRFADWFWVELGRLVERPAFFLSAQSDNTIQPFSETK